MEFSVFFSEDYRTGPKIWLEPKQADDSEVENPEYSGTVTFDLAPQGKYRVYYCEVDDSSYDIMVRKLGVYSDLEKAINICLQIYSKINGHSPFEDEDPSFGWKPTGKFPSPMKITNSIVKNKIPEIPEGFPVFATVVDQEGNIVYVELITPA